MDAVERLVQALLYEGYILWPYRRTATKNRQRWTPGGVYPRPFGERHPDDPWMVETECLLRPTAGHSGRTALSVEVRFLQLVERTVVAGAGPELRAVDELRADGERYVPGEDAVERRIALNALEVGPAPGSWRTPIAIDGGVDEEAIADDGRRAGGIIRRWEPLRGYVEVRTGPVAPESHDASPGRVCLAVTIANETPLDLFDRASALRRAFVSAHALLRVCGGEFVSLMDPPQELGDAAAACRNRRLWPVLVGEKGRRDAMLASPVILYDYPEIAPETPGDLCDGTEIDQLLRLNILALTDEEKSEMRAGDPRARAILERTERLSPAEFGRLHGAIREFRTLHPAGEEETLRGADLAPSSLRIDGVDIRRGSRVRLHPRRGADVFDLVLAGRLGTVTAIEEDYEDRIHLAVTVDGDPGSDLGGAAMLAHRFYFSPDEVEPVEAPDGTVPPSPERKS
jgi:hypothetical protein